MQQFGFQKTADTVSLYDEEARPKSSRAWHDTVSPGHIPGICFSVDFTQETEKLSLRLPASTFNLIPLFRDCPDTARGVKAPLNQETGEIERSDNGDVNPALGRLQRQIELPGGLWDVLLSLKVVLEDDWDGSELFFGAGSSPLPGALQMASFLGWTDAQRAMLQCLSGHWLPFLGTPTAGGPQRLGGTRFMALLQVMESLPDEYFSLIEHPALGSSTQLVRSMGDVFGLPPQLKVKWLRADCLASLDLSAPPASWSLASWQELALCMHAVPALETLAVRLPRYPLAPPKKQMSVAPPRWMRAGDLDFDLTYGGRHARIFQRAPAQPPAVPEAAPPADDSEYACAAGIRVLGHVALALPCLKSLIVTESPVKTADVQTLASAVAAFKQSLTHLAIDAWRVQGEHVAASEGGPLTLPTWDRARQAAQAADLEHKNACAYIACMTQLRVLSIRDWSNVSVWRCWFDALRKLPRLEEVRVSDFPCQMRSECGQEGSLCDEHPHDLPFKAHESVL